MAKTYYVTPTRTRRKQSRLAFESGQETISFDYTSWAQVNGTVTTVTVTVESGQAAISNEALTSNVKSMVVTISYDGRSLIKLVATAGNNKDVQWLEVVARDLDVETQDYE